MYGKHIIKPYMFQRSFCLQKLESNWTFQLFINKYPTEVMVQVEHLEQLEHVLTQQEFPPQLIHQEYRQEVSRQIGEGGQESGEVDPLLVHLLGGVSCPVGGSLVVIAGRPPVLLYPTEELWKPHPQSIVPGKSKVRYSKSRGHVMYQQ